MYGYSTLPVEYNNETSSTAYYAAGTMIKTGPVILGKGLSAHVPNIVTLFCGASLLVQLE